MAYATLDDLIKTFGEHNLSSLLVDDNGDLSPFNQWLDNASSEIDGYLNARYKVPLKVVPSIVKEWTCSITYYKRSLEYGDGLTEEKRKRYDDIFDYLKDIVKGIATIPELESKEGVSTKPEGRIALLLDDNNPSRAVSRRSMNGL